MSRIEKEIRYTSGLTHEARNFQPIWDESRKTDLFVLTSNSGKGVSKLDFADHGWVVTFYHPGGSPINIHTTMLSRGGEYSDMIRFDNMNPSYFDEYPIDLAEKYVEQIIKEQDDLVLYSSPEKALEFVSRALILPDELHDAAVEIDRYRRVSFQSKLLALNIERGLEIVARKARKIYADAELVGGYPADASILQKFKAIRRNMPALSLIGKYRRVEQTSRKLVQQMANPEAKIPVIVDFDVSPDYYCIQHGMEPSPVHYRFQKIL